MALKSLMFPLDAPDATSPYKTFANEGRVLRNGLRTVEFISTELFLLDFGALISDSVEVLLDATAYS
jgi:hypothetical protein